MISSFDTKRHAVWVDVPGQSRKSNNTLPLDPLLWEPGQNVVFNRTRGKRETHFIMDRRGVKLTGKACLINCNPKPPPVVVKPVETKLRLWSDKDSWGTDGHVPLNGENVTIESGWNMLLDVGDLPRFDIVTINGKLSVYNLSMDFTLRANKILIRVGEFHIGSKDKPYLGNALIQLNGTNNETEHDDHRYILSEKLESGGAYIANIGLLKFYGKPRKQLMTRLRKEAYKGDEFIIVDPNLDFDRGDLLALLPTSYDSKHTEKVVVNSYDPKFGNVTLEKPLNYYHYGAKLSTAKKYNGVDIRGEVLLLSRNIKI